MNGSTYPYDYYCHKDTERDKCPECGARPRDYIVTFGHIAQIPPITFVCAFGHKWQAPKNKIVKASKLMTTTHPNWQPVESFTPDSHFTAEESSYDGYIQNNKGDRIEIANVLIAYQVCTLLNRDYQIGKDYSHQTDMQLPYPDMARDEMFDGDHQLVMDEFFISQILPLDEHIKAVQSDFDEYKRINSPKTDVFFEDNMKRYEEELSRLQVLADE